MTFDLQDLSGTFTTFDIVVSLSLSFVLSTAIGWVYRLFKAADLRGLLLYPVMFIGLLEVGLILYWPTGRALPSVVGGLVLGIALHRAQRRSGPAVP